MDPMKIDGGTSYKRKAEVEAGRFPIKKQLIEKDSSLLKLPKELIETIFGYFNFCELVQASLSCRNWKEITDNMFIWTHLFSNLKLNPAEGQTRKECFIEALAAENNLALFTPANAFCESRNIYKKNLINYALVEFKMLKAYIKCPEIEKIIKNKIKYLNMIQLSRGYSQSAFTDSSDVERFTKKHIKKNILPDVMRLNSYLECYFIAFQDLNLSMIHYNNAIQDFLRIQPAIPKNFMWISLRIDYLIALFRLYKRITIITDDQATSLLFRYSQSKQTPKFLRLEALQHIAEMREQKRTDIISDNRAFIIFHNNSLNFKISKECREKAVLSKARMGYDKKTSLINDKEVVKLLWSLIQNLTTNESIRKKALSLHGKMKIEERTKLMTDQELAKVFFADMQDCRISAHNRKRAKWIVANMQAEKRTDLMNDKVVVKLFFDIITGTDYPPEIIEKAQLNIARMRVENRTDLIDDDKAFTILFDFFLRKDVPKIVRVLSVAFHIAKMRVENRTFKINIPEAIKFLELVVDPNFYFEKDIKTEAQTYLDKLLLM
ncbi:MAG TPA: F-box protein [Parachlamydiaceae bacterium]|nr:F-box protein [Parachlamydiaceae bacterium]